MVSVMPVISALSARRSKTSREGRGAQFLRCIIVLAGERERERKEGMKVKIFVSLLFFSFLISLSFVLSAMSGKSYLFPLT